MDAQKLLSLLVFVSFTLPQQVLADDRIEPNAGNWRTWVISSGKDYRVPPPPRPEETRAELRALADLIGHNDAQIQQQIAFWDAGAPAYRWIDMINARLLAGTPTTSFPHRVSAYVALAMYDATIAAWESKYFYDRKRPSALDHKLPMALRFPTTRRIRPNTPRQPKLLRAFSRTSCRSRRNRSRAWRNRRAGRACLQVFNIPATTTPVSPSAGESPNRSRRR